MPILWWQYHSVMQWHFRCKTDGIWHHLCYDVALPIQFRLRNVSPRVSRNCVRPLCLKKIFKNELKRQKTHFVSFPLHILRQCAAVATMSDCSTSFTKSNEAPQMCFHEKNLRALFKDSIQGNSCGLASAPTPLAETKTKFKNWIGSYILLPTDVNLDACS